MGTELAARQAELADLRVTGRRWRRALERAERRVADLERRRAALHERRAELSGLVGVAAEQLLDDDRPETAVESLDGSVPVALLPVRIETRFADANTTLHIRIFPDQVHLDAHEPAFTDDERAGAEWYWNERWPALDDAERAERAWTHARRPLPPRPGPLPARHAAAGQPGPRARRAAGVPRRPPGGPARGRGRSRPPPSPSAGWRSGSRTPWRCSGSGRTGCPIAWPPVRRRTSSRRPPPPDADARVPHVQDAFRWAVDPDAARAAGMLLTVRDSDMAFGRPLANGLTRLVVLGVDWTLTPEQGADALEGAARRPRRVR